MNIGDEIKLKDYSGYIDWRQHYDEIGVLIDTHSFKGKEGFDYLIKWKDRTYSNAPLDNLRLAQTKVQQYFAELPEKLL